MGTRITTASYRSRANLAILAFISVLSITFVPLRVLQTAKFTNELPISTSHSPPPPSPPPLLLPPVSKSSTAASIPTSSLVSAKRQTFHDAVVPLKPGITNTRDLRSSLVDNQVSNATVSRTVGEKSTQVEEKNEAARTGHEESLPLPATSALANPVTKSPGLKKHSRAVLEATVVAIAITRDDAQFLPRALEMVRACLAPFKSYDLIIVENDSKDGTQDILAGWARADRRIIVESRNMSHNTSVVGKKTSIGLMAALRNRALELAYLLSYSSTIRHAWSADLLVVFDLDIQAIDVAGFANAALEVLSGRMAGATPNGVFQDGRYYDLYAFRNCNLRWNPRFGPVMRKLEKSAFKTLMPLYTKDLEPFPVDSAFSGAAIYRTDAVFGPRVWLGEGRYLPEGSKVLPSDGAPGTLSDTRARVPQWRGHELTALLSKRPKDTGEKYRYPSPQDANTTANPASPHYFAVEAVKAGRHPFMVDKMPSGDVLKDSVNQGIDLPPHVILPCVYSDAASRECEHVAFSACVNARAAALNIPPIHMLPSWGVLYGQGQSPQLKKAGEEAVFVLPGPENASEFSIFSVLQPMYKSLRKKDIPAYWKGPGSPQCSCSLSYLC